MANADIGLRVFLDDTASSGLGALGGNISRLGYLVGGLGSQWETLGKIQQGAAVLTAGASLAFAGFAGVVVWAVKSAADFDTAMAKVILNVQGAKSEVPALTTLMFQLGSQSIYSSQQIADAMALLGAKGFDAADMLNTQLIPATLQLAEAMGQDDAAGAARLLGTVMQQFGASADQATQYANALDIAFHNGIPDVMSMQQAFVQSSAFASLLGENVQDLASTLAIMTQYMGSGSQAGISLRNAMMGIMNPATNAISAMGQLGIVIVNQASPAIDDLVDRLYALGGRSRVVADGFDGSARSLQNLWNQANKVNLSGIQSSFMQWALSTKSISDQFYDAKGKFIGFQGAVDLVAQKLKAAGYSGEETQAILVRMFNQTGAKGFLELVQNVDKVNGKFGDLRGQMKQTDRAASDANTAIDNLNAKWKTLQTTMVDLGKAIGTPIANMLTPLIGKFNDFVGHINVLMAKNPAIAQTVSHFLLMGGAAAGIGMLSGFLVLIATSLGGVALAVGGIALAFLALPIVIKLVQDHWKSMADAALNFLNFIKPGLAAVAAVIGGVAVALLVSLIPSFLAGIGVVAGFTGALGVAFVVSAVRAVMAIPAIIAANGGLIGSFWAAATSAWAAAGAFLAASWPLLLLIAVGIAVGAAIYLMVTHFKSWGDAFNQIGRVVGGVFGPIIKDTIGMIVSTFQQMSSMLLDQLKPAWQDIMQAFNAAKPALMAIGGIIIAIGGAVLLLATGVVVGALKGFIALLVGVISGLATVFVGIIRVVSGIVTVVLGIFSLLHGIFTLNGNEIKAAFGTIIHGIGGIFAGLGTIIGGILLGTFGAVIAMVVHFVSGFIGFFQHLWDVLVGHSIIPDMVRGIISWITQLPAKILGLIGGLVSGVIGHFRDMATGALSHITSLFHGSDTTGQQMKLKYEAHMLEMKAKVIDHMQQMTAQSIMHENQMKQKLLVEMANCKDEHTKHILSMKIAAINNVELMQIESARKAQTMKISMIKHAEELKERATKLAEEQKKGVGQHFADLVSSTMSNITGWVGNMLGKIGGLKDNILSKIADLRSSMVSKFQDIVSTVLSTVGSLPGKMLDLGGNIIKSIASGIMSAIGNITSAMGSVGDAIMSHLPHSPAEKGPLMNIDKPMPAMMRMFAQGIRGNIGHVTAAMGDVGSAIMSSGSMLTPNMQRSVAAYGPPGNIRLGDNRVTVQIGNEQLFELVMNQITGQLKLNGMGRTFR